MEKIKYIMLLLLLPSVSLATDPEDTREHINHMIFDRDVIEYHTGSFLNNMENTSAVNNGNNVSRKSPLLAAVMSAAVPGAGEVYAGRWWRGLAHFGLEVTSWAFYFHYDSRGDDQTARFERYANQNWDVTKYAQWLNIYWLDLTSASPITIDPDESKNPWERVNWSEIHAIEAAIAQFSHRLEPFDTQQYYELIGKYPQYTRGWEDSDPIGNFNPDDNEIQAERNAYFDDISEMFSFYSSKRGYANTLYSRAHTAAVAVFLNHFISAFHAAYLAHSFNQTHLAIDIENRDDIYGDRLVPVVKLQVGV